MKMKQRSILKITILISILLHIAIILALKNINFESKKEENKKIALSFKRGGDSMKKNSPLKENTPPNAKKIAKDSNKVDSIEQSFDIANNNSQSFDLSSLSLNPTPNEKIQNLLQELSQDEKNEIMDLYGDKLGDYGVEEAKFIINNLKEIGRITQYHFSRRGYPKDALYLKQSGSNIAEFYLHPNGDISDLKITQDSNSTILDKNTLTTIEIAHRDYPRPSTKTKIIINMKYFITYK